MARVVSGGWIAARIRRRAPHCEHSRTSSANTRRSRSARCNGAAGRNPAARSRVPRLWGAGPRLLAAAPQEASDPAGAALHDARDLGVLRRREGPEAHARLAVALVDAVHHESVEVHVERGVAFSPESLNTYFLALPWPRGRTAGKALRGGAPER